jgi:hypothetical protein
MATRSDLAPCQAGCCRQAGGLTFLHRSFLECDPHQLLEQPAQPLHNLLQPEILRQGGKVYPPAGFRPLQASSASTKMRKVRDPVPCCLKRHGRQQTPRVAISWGSS